MRTEPFSPDLIIVGGGLAGLTAAVRAAEFGLRPLVLEQGTGTDYPCNTRQSGGILHIAFHDPYREQHELVDIIDRVTGGEAKPQLAKALAQTGSRLITWLQSQGVRFMRFNAQEGYRWCMSPPRALRAGMDWEGRGPDLMLRNLAKSLQKLGGKIEQGARAERLIMEGGRCVGIRGVHNGAAAEWRAPYCILADGGFQANRDLVERFIAKSFDDLFQRGAQTGHGAGLRMAVEAGAALTDCSRFYGHLLCSDAQQNDAVWPYPEIDAIATAGIVIDETGERYVDEGESGVRLANALAARPRSSSSKLFAVFDASIWEGAGRSARIPANPLLEKAGGTVLRADTAEKLAELMGVPAGTFTRMLEEYNAAVEAAAGSRLAVPRSGTPQPIRQAPLMAIPICPGITYTMGGIDINEHSEVLDAEQQPIPGLFAAGANTGGIEGGSRAAYVGGLIKAGSFGLLAAERIASLEGKLHPTDGTRSPEPLHGRTENIAPTSAMESRHGLARFPILYALVRWGKPIAVSTGVLIGLMVLLIGWGPISWLALPAALVTATFVTVLLLGAKEVVTLIAELLMPE